MNCKLCAGFFCVAVLLQACQTPPIVGRKLDDILVQNEDLRRRVMSLEDDLHDISVKLGVKK